MLLTNFLSWDNPAVIFRKNTERTTVRQIRNSSGNEKAKEYMKKYATWLKTAAIFQFITAVIHAISLFVTPPPSNEAEKQLFTLTDTTGLISVQDFTEQLVSCHWN